LLLSLSLSLPPSLLTPVSISLIPSSLLIIPLLKNKIFFYSNKYCHKFQNHYTTFTVMHKSHKFTFIRIFRNVDYIL
jgi:hypothetical protein